MKKTRFMVSVNDGPEQEIRVATGLYVSAAAAVPALLGIEIFPVRIKIWVPRLLPEYGPYEYEIAEPGGAAEHLVTISDEVAARYRAAGMGHLIQN